MPKTKTLSGTFDEIIAQVKKMVEQGNARRLIVRNKEGKTMLEVPLTLGLAGGTVAGVMAPVLSGLAAFAIFIQKYEIVVEKYDNSPDAEEADFIEVQDEEHAESDNEQKKNEKAKDEPKSDENT
jgi:hypothetical protein